MKLRLFEKIQPFEANISDIRPLSYSSHEIRVL
jgi:hypothetical protein